MNRARQTLLWITALALVALAGWYIVHRVTRYSAMHCAREHAITDGDIVACYTDRGLGAPEDMVSP